MNHGSLWEAIAAEAAIRAVRVMVSGRAECPELNPCYSCPSVDVGGVENGPGLRRHRHPNSARSCSCKNFKLIFKKNYLI